MIDGAVYGLMDVTSKLREMYAAGTRNFGANDAAWTNSWPGVQKTFAVSFRHCKENKTVIVREGQAITLP